MNRERKYRVWDKKQMRMFYSLTGLRVNWNKITGSDLFCEIEAIDGRSGKWTCSDKLEEYEIMDYIGLKDRNEKEIYDKDIVKGPNGKMLEIEFKEYAWWVTNVRIKNTGNNKFGGVESYPLAKLLDYYRSANVDMFERIGDIYTTPELLSNGQVPTGRP